MSVLKGTNVASTIVPFTTDDTYATHDSLYGKGGYKEVATEQERDAIPGTRLKEGTKVYVQETKQEYRYIDGKWELIVYSSGGSSDPSNPTVTPTDLDDLTDVEISSAKENQVLMYDGSKWVNSDIDVSGGAGGDTGSSIDSLDDIPDVDVSSATANQFLMYDGSKWINTSVESGEGGISQAISKLDDIPDVDVTNVTVNQVLTYDGSKWVGTDIELSDGGSSSIQLDEEVTEYSENPVKSSGIFSAINNTVDNKFVVLSESEYNSISHDANTFYFITNGILTIDPWEPE